MDLLEARDFGSGEDIFEGDSGKKRKKKNRTLVEDGVGSVDVFSLLVGLDDTGNTLCKSRRRQRWLDAAYKKVSLNP